MIELSKEVFIDEALEKRLLPGKQTILYVGMKYDYGDRTAGLSYEHYNFYCSLLEMGYSLIYFDYQHLNARFGGSVMSDLLEEAVCYYNPDLVFYVHYHDWVRHDVWKDMRTYNVIHLADDHWRYEETKPVWELFSNIITTDEEGYQKRRGGYNVIKSQWAANDSLYRNLYLPIKYDVSFVGRCYGERKVFIGKLREAGIKVYVPQSRVSQAEMIKIYNQSRIGLNFSLSSKGNKVQVKGRDFEIPCCGTALLTQDSDEIRKCFVPGEEIIVYKDADDAIKQCQHYLKDTGACDNVANAGWDRTLTEHTYRKRMDDILNSIFE